MGRISIVGDVSAVLNAAKEYASLTDRMAKQVTRECAERTRDKIVSTLTPFKDSGEMVKSVQVRAGTQVAGQMYNFDVTIGVKYASYFFEGTRPSPGRYVPAIDRRLTTRGVRRSRRLVTRLTRKLGMPKGVEQAIRKVPIKLEGLSTFRRDYSYVRGVIGIYTPSRFAPGAPYGTIKVMRAGTKMQMASTIRHELWHAVQAEYSKTTGIIDQSDIEANIKAQEALSPIGMHPGTRDHQSVYSEITRYVQTDIPAYATQRVQQLMGGK